MGQGSSGAAAQEVRHVLGRFKRHERLVTVLQPTPIDASGRKETETVITIQAYA
jgi:hypothetical protein